MKKEFSCYITRPELWEEFSARFVVRCPCGWMLVNTMRKKPASLIAHTAIGMTCPKCGINHSTLIDYVASSIEAFAKREACLAELN